MAYLPLQLNYGIVMLYHIRGQSSVGGFSAPIGFNWGTIYQISPYGIPNYRSVGQEALYSGKEVICQLAFHDTNYPMIEEAKLVTIELGNGNLS